MPGNKDRYKSLLGTLMTLGVAVSILSQLIFLASNEVLRESQVTQMTKYGANDPTMNMSSIHDGFDVAFAPVRYMGPENETFDDPSYGRFFYQAYSWANHSQYFQNYDP